MKLIYKYKHLYLFVLCLALLSCKKFLEEKPVKSVIIPSTIKDFQALLDNQVMYSNEPALLQILSDDFYITASYWQSLTSNFSLNYIWSANAIPHDNSWNNSYMNPIYYSNIVLDQLAVTNLPLDVQYNKIKGTALFYRSTSFFNLSQLYAKPYDQSSLSDLGIVLRTTSDINVRSTRATIGETYNRILTDLKLAADLLPISTELPTRPTKIAAYAELARVYLSMRDYDNAFKYCDMVLQNRNMLLDFNNLVPGVPIGAFNPEVIFHSSCSSEPIFNLNNGKIDLALLSTYNQYDLRKTIFFRTNTGANAGTFAFRGTFAGPQPSVGTVFIGTTVGEMLLIRAECYARKSDKSNTVADINMLLAKRMDKNNWVAIDPSNVIDPLALVLSERRKELVFRGLRWMDVRRLNIEGANIILKRDINGVEYTLPPNDKRGVAQIPYDVVNRSGIPQNLR